jgi:hypothetical protein
MFLLESFCCRLGAAILPVFNFASKTEAVPERLVAGPVNGRTFP